MRLPSVESAIRTARETVARFPMAMLSACVAAITAMWMIESSSNDELPRLLATAVLGLPLLALWLGGLAIFYGVSASRNIKLIPMTLCAVALLTSMGP